MSPPAWSRSEAERRQEGSGEPGRCMEPLPGHPIPGKGASLNPGRAQNCRELLRPGEFKSKFNRGAEVLEKKVAIRVKLGIFGMFIGARTEILTLLVAVTKIPADGASTSLNEKTKQNSKNRHQVFIREKLDKGFRLCSLSGSVEAMK